MRNARSSRSKICSWLNSFCLRRISVKNQRHFEVDLEWTCMTWSRMIWISLVVSGFIYCSVFFEHIGFWMTAMPAVHTKMSHWRNLCIDRLCINWLYYIYTYMRTYNEGGGQACAKCFPNAHEHFWSPIWIWAFGLEKTSQRRQAENGCLCLSFWNL